MSESEAKSERQVAERPSRTPGFDMTYQPEECTFGPTFATRLPSLIYLGFALAVGAVVLIGESSGSGTRIFDFVVVQDTGRMMSMRTFALVLLVGAIASVARAGMRGVRVYPDGVESREITNWVIPRVKRYRWPQLECIILDTKSSVAVDLWDGRREFLPQVSNRRKLEETLERVAAARAIPVRGGKGLDDIIEPESNTSQA
jgi:hypothetical protein